MKKDASKYIQIWGDYAKIELADGSFALIDAIDVPLVENELWCYAGKGYVLGSQGRPKLHRLIMTPADGLEVDHINGNARDNRRSNLRVCDHSENMCNRKAQKARGGKTVSCLLKGVYLLPSGRYGVQLSRNGTTKYVGSFSTAEEAAQVYDAEARAQYGEFALVNYG